MDSKYGRIFTEEDVRSMFLVADATGHSFEDIIDSGEFKFPEDEPLFVLRARDKRALGAVNWYRNHQSATAPQNHLDGCDAAVKAFDEFRIEHRDRMREPD